MQKVLSWFLFIVGAVGALGTTYLLIRIFAVIIKENVSPILGFAIGFIIVMFGLFIFSCYLIWISLKTIAKSKGEKVIAATCFITLVGVSLFLGVSSIPKLLDYYPDYPGATFLKEASATYKGSLDRVNSEIYLNCDSFTYFRAEDYKAYSTTDDPKQVLTFLRQPIPYKFTEMRGSNLDLYDHNDKNVLSLGALTNNPICFIGENKRDRNTWVANVVLFLDPKIKEEEQFIRWFIPNFTDQSLVFFVMRGWNSRTED